MSVLPMSRFAHLATKMFNVPLALHEDKAEILMAALAERFGLSGITRSNGQSIPLSPDALAFEFENDRPGAACGYDVVDGVARIPIEGTLVHKLGALHPVCGMTGYDGIRQNFLTALEDDKVRAILLDVDSPGGEVAGCFDLSDTIYAARGRKPIWSILTESAYSAAYAIASAADRVYVPRTGGAGSIGVIALHVDMSKALTSAGIVVSVVKYGARKDDCADFAPFSDPARAHVQAEVDAMGAIFDALVARNRGLKAATVKSYQAMTFMGAASVEAGLTDAVMAPDAALSALFASI